MTTKVVNIYNHTPTSDDVYIGRRGKDQDGYFGNPFVLGKDGDRDTVLRKYIEWLPEKFATDPEFAGRVKQLKGKILVCFCAPLTCHGDYLALLAEEE